VKLASLGGRGAAIYGNSSNRSLASSLANAGDVNGDGLDDFIVGSPHSGPGGAYVIYGKAGGLASLNVANLTPADGFFIGAPAGSFLAGETVSGAGDINGDGFDDILIGNLRYNNYSGRAFAVFGAATHSGAVDLGTMGAETGFTVANNKYDGTNPYDGQYLTSAGDINHDGYDDFIVGGANSTSAWVILGRGTGFGNIGLNPFDSSNGFTIQRGTNLIVGNAFAGLGDFNGDGIDDFAVGSWLGNGSVNVIFGKQSGFSGVNLSNFTAADGFVMTGASGQGIGLHVSAAGDVNGDGLQDIIFNSNYGGKSYVVFGRPGGAASIDLTNLGTGGFIIQAFQGVAISGAGDVNGDGFDDLIIGNIADSRGGYNAGGAYIVYGKANASGTLSLNSLADSDGFFIQGAAAGDYSGYAVSSAGDVNGDGFGDVLVSAQGNDVGGDHAGAAFVVYGEVPTTDVTRIGSIGDQTIRGGTGNDLLDGQQGDDRLFGGAGNDQLIGGLGADYMDGGAGNDTYAVDNAGDVVVELPGGGTDTVQSSITYTLGDTVENLVLTGVDPIGGTGNALDNVLTGNGAANLLRGGAGNDTLDGGAGADTLEGGAGNDIYVVDNAGDTVTEAAGEGTDEIRTTLAAYALGANVENLTGLSASGQTLTGNGDANIITGGGGNDVLDGGAGADTLIGGLGNDVYYVDAGDTVSEAANAGIDEVRTGVASYALGANVENLTGLSSAGQSLAGNGLDNVIIAGSGNDSVEGGAGNDTMDGGAGVDTLSYAGAGGGITFSLAFGTAQATGGAGTDSAINFENLTGSAFADNLAGNGGDNVIDGGAGADQMAGGLGNDVYYVDNVGDVVTENAGEGLADEVRTSLSGYILAANVEKLTWTGTGGGVFRGNASDNGLTGGVGNDFVGAQDGGNDNVSLGAGNDAVIFGASYTSADVVDGGSGSDQVGLQGDYSGGVTLGTLTGVETLVVMTHSDARFGGGSASPFSYNIVAPDSTVAAGTQLMVNASTLEVGENLTFDGSAETNGSFFIYGGKGVDTLTGGSGADVFFFAEDGRFAATDHIDGGAGQDVMVLRGNYSLTLSGTSIVNVETVVLNSGSDARFYAAGTPFSYDITTADDTVAAGQTMTFNGGQLSAAETLHFDGSLETNGNFRLFGGSADDVIKGGAGNDLIYGGLGHDDLTGGAGADTFRYQGAGESTASASDHILDFASGDIIDLGRIDAVTGGNDDAFHIVGAFDGQAGELVLTQGANNVWTVSGDTDGNGQADFQILVTVSDGHLLTGLDFVL
jgi:Ca2+-binding RTX toxin-like protein